MKKYISKGVWFDKGEECELLFWIDDEKTCGMFKGYRTCTNPKSEAQPLGKKYLDKEGCGLDEFEVIE